MALKLLDELLLVPQLLLRHFKLVLVLLQGGVVLGSHLKLDVVFLELFDLRVQVIELGFVLLDLLFVLCDPLLVLGSQLDLIFFKLLDLTLPLIVALALQQLYLGFELLDDVVLLIELDAVDPLGRGEVAGLVTVEFES